MRIKIALIVAMIVLLCGCGQASIDASFRAPELPEEYVEFNDEIEKIKNEGFELVSPNGGTNRQSVQLTDLDNDGIDEGVAFFKETGGEHKVYAYFFEQSEDGYKISAKIEGSGDTVENVTYSDLMGSGSNEIIIGWSLSDSGARSVGVYSLNDNDAIKLCEVNSLYHVVCDLDNDMISDLCVVYEDPADGLQKIALYSLSEESFQFRASAPLSRNSDTILRIRAAYIGDMQPAVFVEKKYGSAGIITDVIAWKETYLKNMTYSDASGNSDETARGYESYAEDVDFDGALEIPMPRAVTNANLLAEGQTLPEISWYGFVNDRYQIKEYTFRSGTERWTLSIPRDWQGRCTAIYHKQNSTNITTFYSYNADGTSEELFGIVTFTGENRESNAEKAGYTKVLEKNGTLYGVKITKNRYLGYDITPELIAERISYRENEWSTGEVVF